MRIFQAFLGILQRLLVAFPRLLLFVATVAGVAAVAYLATQWTDNQAQAYKTENSTQLVRNINAPWRSLNPDNLENQLLQFYLNLNRASIAEPVDANASPRPFHVALGETGLSISERLQEEGFIHDAAIFRLYMRLNGIDQKLEAGDFLLSPSMSVPQITEALQSARARDMEVRIPEGRRAEEIARLLEDQGVIDAASFLAAVRSGDLALLGLPDFPLLKDKPVGVSFEGYLFPDTYRLPLGATPAVILRIMFEDLENRIDQPMRDRVASSGLTFHQVLTLASIVEREAVLAEERPIIASTYRNRMGETCANQVFGYLQADPTAQYAMGYDEKLKTWWPTVEEVEDYLQINSPYNTYVYPGLPPGPIASPGLASIKAAIAPADTRYCYFVASSGGAHVFAETGAEHLSNVERYKP